MVACGPQLRGFPGSLSRRTGSSSSGRGASPAGASGRACRPRSPHDPADAMTAVAADDEERIVCVVVAIVGIRAPAREGRPHRRHRRRSMRRVRCSLRRAARKESSDWVVTIGSSRGRFATSPLAPAHTGREARLAALERRSRPTRSRWARTARAEPPLQPAPPPGLRHARQAAAATQAAIRQEHNALHVAMFSLTGGHSATAGPSRAGVAAASVNAGGGSPTCRD